MQEGWRREDESGEARVSGWVGGTRGPHFIRPLSESFSHYFSSPSPPSNVSISAAQNRRWTVHK